MTPLHPAPYSRSRVVAALVAMGVAALFAIMMVREWWPIVVARDTVHAATYRFGSETMIERGGWRYANPELYAWTAFGESVAAVAAMPILWMTIVRRSRRAVWALVVVCAVYAGSAFILGQLQWPTRSALRSRS